MSLGRLIFAPLPPGQRPPCSRPACRDRKGGARLALWMLATAGHPPQPRCVACAAEAAYARGIQFPPIEVPQ